MVKVRSLLVNQLGPVKIKRGINNADQFWLAKSSMLEWHYIFSMATTQKRAAAFFLFLWCVLTVHKRPTVHGPTVLRVLGAI